MLRNLFRFAVHTAHHHNSGLSMPKLTGFMGTNTRRLHASKFLSRALAPKTAWGMAIAKAVASLQDGDLLTYEPIKLKGVTFKNDVTGDLRQDILDRLRKSAQSSSATGLPVLLVHEPDNPADPHAVAVISTMGQIGYVPREATHLFQHACSPGYTDWIWQPIDIPSAMLGCSIVAAPALRAAFIQVVPPQLVPFVDIKRWLPGEAWDRLAEDTEDMTLGCCQVTGLTSLRLFPDQEDSAEIAAQVYPSWSLEPRTRTLKLTGCQVLSMPVVFARAMLDLEADAATLPGGEALEEGVVGGLLRELADAHGGREIALDIARSAAVDALLCCDAWYVHGEDGALQVLRSWRPEDVDAYLQNCWEEKRWLMALNMRLDVSWLVDEGYVTWDEIPESVRAVHWRSDQGSPGGPVAGE